MPGHRSRRVPPSHPPRRPPSGGLRLGTVSRAAAAGVTGAVALAVLVTLGYASRSGESGPETATAPAAAGPHAPAGLSWPAEGQTSVYVDGLGARGDLGTRGAQWRVPIASLTKVMTAYVVLRDHQVRAGELRRPVRAVAAVSSGAHHDVVVRHQPWTVRTGCSTWSGHRLPHGGHSAASRADVSATAPAELPGPGASARSGTPPYETRPTGRAADGCLRGRDHPVAQPRPREVGLHQRAAAPGSAGAAGPGVNQHGGAAVGDLE